MVTANQHRRAVQQILRDPTTVEILLPGQLGGGRPSTPERRLCAAVLDDAMRSLRLEATVCGDKSSSVRRAMRRSAQADAVAWVQSDDRMWPFSFVNLCEHLGFDVEWMRAGLLRRARPGRERVHGQRSDHLRRVRA